MNIIVKRADHPADFAAIREDWNGLLQQSNADRLFLSWEWQYYWWSTWGDALDLELVLLKALDGQGNLIGIAPLHRSHVKLKGILPIKRLQFIGNHWRHTGTTRTEFLDFISVHGREREVAVAFLRYLYERFSAHELVICDLDVESPTYNNLVHRDNSSGWRPRIVERDRSVIVHNQSGFQDYIAGLGSNTRLKLYNRRKNLASMGGAEIRYATPDNLEYFFSELNRLHIKRWNKPLYHGLKLKFHQQIAMEFSQRGELEFSLLSIGGEIVSAIYDFRVEKRQYFMQAGFEQNFDKKFSLGLLHLGYAIEDAFAAGVKDYDLLIGKGKNIDYKTRIGNVFRPVVTIQSHNTWLWHYLHNSYERIARNTRQP